MCGIVGFARPLTCKRPLEGGDVLRSMTSALTHRGPDDDGYHVAGGVAMGHRRLSVIDLSGGSQPMCREDLGLAVVYNGEIYNYLELNEELRALGFEPRTRSDTETVLLAYAAWGEACVRRFNGMFAFVIHDTRKKRLYGARDRMGQKPLYFVHRPDFFAFASEPKALLRHPDVDGRMDMASAARYLIFEHVPAPHAIYKGMQKLRSGFEFSFELADGRLRTGAYWQLGAGRSEGISRRDRTSQDYWVERIRHELALSVKRRLIADVPLGVFLSGGIDSSAIVATMIRTLNVGNVKTFTISSSQKGFALSDSAQDVANELGTDHHVHVFDEDAVLDVLPTITSMMDEPLADSSILPTYLLSKFTREHVTVALSGDGGDELFAGYVTFKALRATRLYNALMPGLVHRYVVLPAVGLMPVGYSYLSLDFKVKQFLRGVKASEGQRLWRWLGAFAREELAAILTPDALAAADLDSVYDHVQEIHDEVAAQDAVSRDCAMYAKTYLPGQVLTKVDRATMACSLEARSPLLDVNFVELAASIPSSVRFRRGRLKHIFRCALDGLVDRQILDGPKTGFGSPIAQWFRGPLNGMLRDTLSRAALREGGFLRPDAVETMIEHHSSGRMNLQKPLFALFMLERWRQSFARGQG